MWTLVAIVIGVLVGWVVPCPAFAQVYVDQIRAFFKKPE